MIAVHDLVFSYPDGMFTLSVGELTCEAGARVALTGPSGSGKSTLVDLLSGILVPERGTVTIGDEVITGRSESWRRRFRLRNIGIIFQSYELLPYLTVADNVTLPALVDPTLRTAAIRKRCRDLLASVGLAEKHSRYPGQLSQGEQQRVAICRALITGPEVVIADEPTGNLDGKNARAALDLMLAHVERRRPRATFVMATHNLSLLDPFDQVIDTSTLPRRVSLSSSRPPTVRH